MELVLVIGYGISLFFLFLFSLSQLHLTLVYIKSKHEKRIIPTELTDYPAVTVQLPVYNEKYVVERLIRAVAQFDYPKDKLEIQILDDSTDETTSIIEEAIQPLKLQGLNIQVIHRENRDGFKAGALDKGFQSSSGEFIAIFDADFIPPPDFLRKTLPYFANPQTGVVQTRWAHINKDYSLLTQLQAFGLDAHFSIEQHARQESGSFINFNGTCGVWRKATIADAGGWRFDTLTEDLELSYRAQLKKWKFIYLEDVSTPGELPVVMPAIKSQQYRWNKGGAETARIHFLSVLKSNESWTTKIHAFFHLFNSSVFIGLLVAALLSVPMLYIKYSHPTWINLFRAGSVFLLGFFSITFFYWISTRQFYSHPGRTFVRLYPQFLIVSMGLSLHNGLAVLEGLLGRKTSFIRTPKFNITTSHDSWKENVYVKTQLTPFFYGEAILCIYFLFGIGLGVYLNDWGLLFFHALLAFGFGFVCYYTLKPRFHG